MAPVVRELGKYASDVRSLVCVTAQHRQMLDPFLSLFELRADFDLDVMRDDQSLTDLTARVLVGCERVLSTVKPDWVVLQGDTTTVMAVSLVAFYCGVKVAHVEAGLRTSNKRVPFPEELNRRITSVAADLHFAPTERAREALLSESVPSDAIRVTGNTVVDALLWMRARNRRAPALPAALEAKIGDRKVLLVTAHRRESFDRALEEICLALRDLVQRHADLVVVYPVHLNPTVQRLVRQTLAGTERVVLAEPLDYAAFVDLMDRSHLILTDSGGIQEEAPSLGKPVLVVRDTTERPEGIEAGNAALVGTVREGIVAEAERVLADADLYRRMSQAANPYGDGKAAARIVEALLKYEDGQ